MSLPYAEECRYWKTSSSTSEKMLDKTESLIEGFGGRVLQRIDYKDRGRSVFLFVFQLGEDVFRIKWPVLPLERVSDAALRSARLQAATFIYHDVKARCVSSQILGARSAFFNYLMIGDKTAAEHKQCDFIDSQIPKLRIEEK